MDCTLTSSSSVSPNPENSIIFNTLKKSKLPICISDKVRFIDKHYKCIVLTINQTKAASYISYEKYCSANSIDFPREHLKAVLQNKDFSAGQ